MLYSRESLSPPPLTGTNLAPNISQEHNNWLAEYEKREGSIFKYYNVPNEVDFLKKVDNLSDDRKKYYLQENVKRFLGEFVGKIPYTTIPYEVDKKGISYAGMYVKGSYQQASDMGGDREKVETQGFLTIEQTYINAINKKEQLPVGAWISPPLTGNYGFIFLFSPNKNGHIKEYVLRYPENISSLEMSTKLFQDLSPNYPPPLNVKGFLSQPLFDASNQNSQTIINSILKNIGITQNDIQKSYQFENEVDIYLSEWINSYSSLVMSLASYEKGSLLYEYGILEAKKNLLAIYKKAEEIQIKISLSNSSIITQPHYNEPPLLGLELWGYAASFKDGMNERPITSGGSCPAVENTNAAFTLSYPFVDNLKARNTLANGNTLNSLFTKKERYDDYECPQCKKSITGELVGQPDTWKKECPHCNGELRCAK